ncbi:asparagine--tRNA ligase [Patescibacteria group bacterium]|nr:asparagine--tRNA ligase [Patescibacteria group bacterium]
MASLTLIKKIQKETVGQTVTLRGWAHNIRSSGSIIFIEIRDGSGFIQGIIEKKQLGKKGWAEAEKITRETSLEIEGLIQEHPRQKGVFEAQIKKISLKQVADEYPIGKKNHGPDFLLDHRHLWLRDQKQWAIQSIRQEIIKSTYQFLWQNDFTKIDSPILTPTACEGTTTLFELEYFNLGKAYLSQSGQLYLEAAIAAHNKVFDFGPTFRAEKSKTRKHLIEFWMMDAEMAFVEHQESMNIQEKLISFIVQRVLKNKGPELDLLARNKEKLEKTKPPFSRLTYQEAIQKLQKMGSKIKFGDDFGAEDETLITADSEIPVFIEKWPEKIKAFYMKSDPQNNKLVLGADLIAPEGYGEIIGGSQREDDYQILKKKMKAAKIPLQYFQWYLDLRKYGSAPHSGFGYGLERIVAWICGCQHIRETIPFPRLINRLTP